VINNDYFPAIKSKNFIYRWNQIIYLAVYLMCLLLILINLPKNIWIYYQVHSGYIVLGGIGLWRYSWWMIHVIRSIIYGNFVYPHRSKMAAKLWNSGWRPKQLFFMMTTFNEVRTITEKVLQTILTECDEINIPTKLFVGTGSQYDEDIIENFFQDKKISYLFEVIMVRQIQPGKRYAIGETLRAIQSDGLTLNDPVIFMDGDTYFMPGCLRKCLPFFELYPKMQALTTYEQAVILNGPLWMKKWLEMRFAQRDFTMQSYALSNKIMTLTGRMSIFRGKHVLEKSFVDVIENDHLDHWLWGNFRFLSGDDKSTWYYLLKAGAQMMYVPDATTITIENITGNSLDRMIENLRRWCGNTLRNGQRAINLGPRKVGFFIWWCLIDQRISIWTMLVGHMIILLLCFTKTPAFLLVAILWIAFSRLCTSMVLYYYAKKIDISFPLILYFNQLLSAVIKVYILFRLPRQKWKNRGDQRAGFALNGKISYKNLVASYLTFFYCAGFFLLILFFLHIIRAPILADFRIL